MGVPSRGPAGPRRLRDEVFTEGILWANPRFFFLSPFASILYSVFFGN